MLWCFSARNPSGKSLLCSIAIRMIVSYCCCFYFFVDGIYTMDYIKCRHFCMKALRAHKYFLVVINVYIHNVLLVYR